MRCWRAMPASTLTAKPVAARQLAGQSIARIDLADKVFGRPRFIHDRAFDGLLHGRVLRPAAPGAKLLALDATATERHAGRRGGGARRQLRRRGRRDGAGRRRCRGPAARGRTMERRLRAARRDAACRLAAQPPCRDDHRRQARGRQTRPLSRARMRHSYTRPFLAHASMAPSCAVARWGEPALEVWTHTQGIFNLRADLAVALSRPLESIVVEHMEGAGCFGQNGADDVAFDAVLLARAVPGRPVRLQWSREDEMSWAPLGAGMAIDIEADLDADGEIVGWRHDGVEQRARVAAGPGQDADAARRVAAGPAVRAHDRHQPAGFRPAAAPSATRCRSMISRPGRSPATACWRCRSAPRRCARSAPSATCSRSSASSTSCAPSAARTRSPSACATLSDPRARAVLEAAARRAGWSGRRKSETASATAWPSPATRTRAPIARSSPRWKARPTCACGGWWRRSTSAR